MKLEKLKMPYSLLGVKINQIIDNQERLDNAVRQIADEVADFGVSGIRQRIDAILDREPLNQ